MSEAYDETVGRNGETLAVTLGDRAGLDAVAVDIARQLVEARLAGRAARSAGKGFHENPYPLVPRVYARISPSVAWRIGWTKGRPPTREPAEAIDLVRNADGVEVSVYSQDRGTEELRQHVDIDYAEAVGSARRVARTRDVLQDLFARGDITGDELRAGRVFAAAFYRAQLDPVRIVDLTWTAGGGTGGNVADDVLDARDLIARMIRALGGHRTRQASAAWYCIGCGESIGAFARRVRMGQARRMNDSVAKGVLISVLETLAPYLWYNSTRGIR